MRGKKANCGPAELRIRSVFVADKQGGVPGLFRNRRIGYSYNTRVAIRKACELLELGPGDEILAPAYNCGSEIDPLLDAGLEVTFYPVDRQARIDLAGIEAKISDKTRAVYLTHYFGMLQADTAAVRALCDRYGLFLIEDCALSLLSGNAPAEGYSGDISVFCFYKFFPVPTGGAMVINTDSVPGAPLFSGRAPTAQVYKERLRLVLGMLLGARALGGLKRLRQTSRVGAAVREPEPWPDMPSDYYFDPHLSDARIDPFARWPLRSFDVEETIRLRRENYLTYLRLLAGVEGVSPLFPELPENACPQSFPVLVNRRDDIAASLAGEGIDASAWWAGYNLNLSWGEDFDDAAYLKNNVLSLPLHQSLSPDAIAHIVDRLLSAVRN